MFSRVRRWLHAPAAGGRKGPVANAMPDAPAAGQSLELFRQGVAYYRDGDLGRAQSCMDEALARQHDLAEAHFYLAKIHHKRAEPEEATDCLLLATAFKPDLAEAWFYLGAIDLERKRYAQARRNLETALRIEPGLAKAHNALGAVALGLGAMQDAAGHFERALETQPDFALAHSNLGYVLLRELGDYERGIEHLETALRLAPDDPNVRSNHTLVSAHRGLLDEVIATCDELLARDPNHHEARLNRALAMLKLGRFAEGWADYEARKHARSSYIPRPFKFAEWNREALEGRTILVYAEQGLGDEIMFASCVPDLTGRAGRCVLECSPRLQPLFARSFAGVRVCAGEQDDPDPGWLRTAGRVDFQVACGSLPGYFRRRLTDFPSRQGYLHADAGLTAHWRQRLLELGSGLKVGISWHGGTHHTSRAERSIELTALEPLLRTSGCAFVSLQYGSCKNELATLQRDGGICVWHWPDAIADYDETAALVSALDLVISVDTSVAHLSGALGKSTWVFVPSNPDWRYMTAGERMPWYPSLRLFRRDSNAGWLPVIERARAELEHFARPA